MLYWSYILCAVGYADDVVILSSTVSGMDHMLHICSVFSLEYDVLFNASKSKVVTYEYCDRYKYVRDVNFSLMQNQIEISGIEKHLAHGVCNNIELM